MTRTETSKEKELETLLREAVKFLKARGIYYYNSQRRGVASDLLARIEKVIGE